MRYFVKIFIFAVLNIFLFAGLSHAEKVTFVKEYTYQASESDSKISSRTNAFEQVKRLLLEEIGTYVTSVTEVNELRLTKDQITAYSAGTVQVKVIEENWDGRTYWLKASVAVNPNEVVEALKKFVEKKVKDNRTELTEGKKAKQDKNKKPVTTRKLTTQDLKNAEYVIIKHGKIKLKNGEYGNKADIVSENHLSVTFEKAEFGDLNDDGVEDAVVILNTYAGGNRSFMELAAVLNRDGAPYNIASIDMGYSVPINFLSIESGNIIIDMMTYGPNDAMCCPTERKVFRYKLSGWELVQIFDPQENNTSERTATSAVTTPIPAPAPVLMPPRAFSQNTTFPTIIIDELFTVKAGAERYYVLTLRKGDRIFIETIIFEGGNKDINFFIMDAPNASKYKKGEKYHYLGGLITVKDTLMFEVPHDGQYYLFYDNKFSFITSKKVKAFVAAP